MACVVVVVVGWGWWGGGVLGGPARRAYLRPLGLRGFVPGVGYLLSHMRWGVEEVSFRGRRHCVGLGFGCVLDLSLSHNTSIH